MKNLIIGLVLVLLVAGSLVSCVTLDDREMSMHEKADANIIGTVTSTFTAFQPFHIPVKNGLKNRAYTSLIREAKKQYEGNIEIKNIIITGGFSVWEILPLLLSGIPWSAAGYDLIIPPIISGGIILSGNFQKITATGDVVLLSNTGVTSGKQVTNERRPTGNQSGVETAMNNAAEVMMGTLQRNQKLAIVNVSSNDKDISEFVANELEFLLVNNKFTVVDRSELDRIRREQNFQLSGDVDDNTIVSIGKFAGADMVITGAITGSGETRRLRLRALNTQTAQVMSVASERF